MFEEYIVGKIALFTKKLCESTCRFHICRSKTFVRKVCNFSTVPGLYIPVFLVDADFLGNGASPIALAEVGRKLLQ